MAVDLARVTLLLAGGGMVCLAAALLATARRRSAHLAVAALLAARGFGTLIPQVSTQRGWSDFAIQAQPPFVLALPFLALLCLAWFPHEVRHARRWTAVAVGTAGLAVAVYLAVPASFHTLAPGTDGGAMQATPGLVYTSFGPLSAVAALSSPAIAAVAVVLALRYRADPVGGEARPLLLACAGLLASSLFDGASRAVALADTIDAGGFAWLPWGFVTMVGPVLALPTGLFALAALLAGRDAQARPFARTENMVAVLGIGAVLAGLARLAMPAQGDPAGNAAVLAAAGVFRLLMPALLGYALLVRMAPQTGSTAAWSGVVLLLATMAWALAGLLGDVLPDPAPVLAALALSIAAAASIRFLVPRPQDLGGLVSAAAGVTLPET